MSEELQNVIDGMKHMKALCDTETATLQARIAELEAMIAAKDEVLRALSINASHQQLAIIEKALALTPSKVVETVRKKDVAIERAFEVLTYINKACLCSRKDGFDYGQTHKILGFGGDGTRWKTPTERVSEAMTVIEVARAAGVEVE